MPPPKRRKVEHVKIDVRKYDELFKNISPKTFATEWVSASSVKSYFLKEPLLEWLPVHHDALTKFAQETKDYELFGLLCKSLNHCTPEELDSNSFTEFIMDKGNKFETKINSHLQEKFKDSYVNIGGSHDNKTQELFYKTVEALNDGVPIISSAVLYDFETKTYGVADLIVKHNWLEKIISNIEDPDSRQENYVVIDIKYTSLKLAADGIHLLNSDLFPSYKSQIYIYTRALSKILGTSITKGYVLGRKWQYTKKGVAVKGCGVFDKLGTIDYECNDEGIIEETNNAVKWIIDIRQQKPDELFKNIPLPNMKNDYDYPWGEVKKYIAKKNNDITLVWQCNSNHRHLAHSQGIFKYTDKQCTAANLGFPEGKYTANLLDEILDINRSTEPMSTITREFKNAVMEKKDTIDFFIDFETVNDSILSNFAYFPQSDVEGYIFQIGIGYASLPTSPALPASLPASEIPLTGWTYKSFLVNTITSSEEKRICQEFISYVKNISTSQKKNIRFFHWSGAETQMWQKTIEKHSNLFPTSQSTDKTPSGAPMSHPSGYTPSEWFDLLKLFKNEAVTVKGAVNFSLKNIANAMYSHGMIQTHWDECVCADGKMAMLGAHLVNEQVKKECITTIKNHPIIKDIEKYNECDCKTIFEIVNYIRNYSLTEN